MHSRKDTYDFLSTSTSCDNYSYTYYCNGHSVDACFGHKDIEVTVTTTFMEQMFESSELPTSSTSAHYGSYWTRLSKFKSNPEAWNDGWTIYVCKVYRRRDCSHPCRKWSNRYPKHF